MIIRKTKGGVFIMSEDTRKYPRTPTNSRCCSLHWLPSGEVCEDYHPDTGPGILMKSCTNCYYYGDRRLKYNKV